MTRKIAENKLRIKAKNQKKERQLFIAFVDDDGEKIILGNISEIEGEIASWIDDFEIDPESIKVHELGVELDWDITAQTSIEVFPSED